MQDTRGEYRGMTMKNGRNPKSFHRIFAIFHWKKTLACGILYRLWQAASCLRAIFQEQALLRIKIRRTYHP